MQGNYLISVLITNYNTLDFMKLSLCALRCLTKNSYRVLINDNGSRPKEIFELHKIQEENENIFVNFRKSYYNKVTSYAHAEALDILINLVDTEYTAILDSDCIFLIKDWDELLINEINDKVKIVGSPLPKGRSGQKPDDFPFQFAVLFETKTYKDLKISCMPKDISKGQDTCWEWKPKFINSGYKGKILIAKNTRDFKDGPFRDLIGVEEYYTDNGSLVASHFGRGSSAGMAKYYNKWFLKVPFLSKGIRRYIGEKEKKKWMNICYSIINNQKAQ